MYAYILVVLIDVKEILRTTRHSVKMSVCFFYFFLIGSKQILILLWKSQFG